MPDDPRAELKKSFFYVMSIEDRIKYCNEAKNFAGLDAVTPLTNPQLKYVGDWFHTVILECRTLPISYLYFYSMNDIEIWMKGNEFFKYHFEVQITNLEPVLYTKSTSK